MKSMKYKVLAADDEFWSRENIRSLIPWEEYSLEFLEPACDGEEVLERIPEEKPDIILTDINMPFLSGLELLQRLQNEYPNIVTIAISGYDDFDKVKEYADKVVLLNKKVLECDTPDKVFGSDSFINEFGIGDK